jgi:bifunctional non-homologous end joining protein LigD
VSVKGRVRRAAPAAGAVTIPSRGDVTLEVGGRRVELTNLQKIYFPERKLAKHDLLQYYADIAPVLLPHVTGRAITMKRYPNGIHGKFFFMKRAPEPRPEWIETCSIAHAAAGIVAFPLVQDLPSLLWLINLGCIDINQWYGTCDDPDRPDYLHFDLDPVEGTPFDRVLDVALVVREALVALGMKPLAKTSGSSGMHIYVPIVRGPLQKRVWTVAKQVAVHLEKLHPKIVTAEYRIARRPKGRVLVDYNQNAWGKTLASIYSVRPNPDTAVSTPVTWDEVEAGFEIADFRMDSVPARVAKLGDLWKPLLARRGRYDLEKLA